MSRLPGKRGGKHGLWYGFKRAVKLSAWPALNRGVCECLKFPWWEAREGWYKFLIKPDATTTLCLSGSTCSPFHY
jgi:hypothetical protein